MVCKLRDTWAQSPLMKTRDNAMIHQPPTPTPCLRPHHPSTDPSPLLLAASAYCTPVTRLTLFRVISAELVNRLVLPVSTRPHSLVLVRVCSQSSTNMLVGKRTHPSSHLALGERVVVLVIPGKGKKMSLTLAWLVLSPLPPFGEPSRP